MGLVRVRIDPVQLPYQFDCGLIPIFELLGVLVMFVLIINQRFRPRAEHVLTPFQLSFVVLLCFTSSKLSGKLKNKLTSIPKKHCMEVSKFPLF
jgi:hypothetical protein